MSKILEITPQNFNQEVLKSKLPILVDFWAPWCGPCQMLGSILDELAEELEGKVKIVKLDVGDSANQELAAKYQIQSVPVMKIFKEGEMIKEIVGLKPKDILKKELLNFLAS